MAQRLKGMALVTGNGTHPILGKVHLKKTENGVCSIKPSLRHLPKLSGHTVYIGHLTLGHTWEVQFGEAENQPFVFVLSLPILIDI